MLNTWPYKSPLPVANDLSKERLANTWSYKYSNQTESTLKPILWIYKMSDQTESLLAVK